MFTRSGWRISCFFKVTTQLIIQSLFLKQASYVPLPSKTYRTIYIHKVIILQKLLHNYTETRTVLKLICSSTNFLRFSMPLRLSIQTPGDINSARTVVCYTKFISSSDKWNINDQKYIITKRVRSPSI